MHSKPLVLVLSVLWLLCGCAATVRQDAGKSVLWVSRKQAKDFLRVIGHTNVSPIVSRDSKGEYLFFRFENAQGHHVAIVSANGVTVKDLPGRARLNDDAAPVFWVQDSTKTIHFANGDILPTNVHTLNLISDGRFVVMFDSSSLWIADVSAPMKALVTFPGDARVQKVWSRGDRLHVFMKGQPEGRPRRDGWAILKRYEYTIEGGTARLVQTQDFDFTWQVFDFDPETNLMVSRSWDDMFPRAWLVDTASGRRKNLGFARGYAFLLKTPVIERFQEIFNN